MKIFHTRFFQFWAILFIISFLLGCKTNSPDNLDINSRNNNFSNPEFLNQLYERADSIKFVNPDSASNIIYTCLQSNPSDSLFIANCYKLLGVTYIMRSNIDSAKYFENMAYEFAADLKDTLLLANTLQNIAIIDLNLSDYSHARDELQIAASYYLKLNELEKYSDVVTNIGTCFEYLGKLDSAMHYLQKGLTIKEKFCFDKSIHISYTTLASLNYRLKNYQVSESYFQKAIRKQKELNLEFQLCNSYSSISALYLNWGRVKEAIEYLELSEGICLKLNVKHVLANTYSNLGTAYYQLKDYHKSKYYLEKSLKLSKETQTKLILASSYLNLGIIYHLSNDEVISNQYFDSAYYVANEMNDLNFLNTMYLDHSNLSEEQGVFNKAYFYLKKHIAINDSIYTIEKLKTIEDLHIKYETEKKDLTIGQNTLQLKKQKITIYSILIISFLLITGFITNYKVRLKILNANIELYKRNQELAKLKAENKFLIKRNGLSDEKTTDIIERLNQMLEGEKIYKSSDLTITKLAETLNTNREYLSQIFNQTLGTKFNDYINSYRIEEAKQILDKETKLKSSQQTMLAIANEVGFKNTSTFNPAFKKHTGLTPSEYKDAGKSV